MKKYKLIKEYPNRKIGDIALKKDDTEIYCWINSSDVIPCEFINGGYFDERRYGNLLLDKFF